MKRTIEYCDELVNDKSRTYYEIVRQIQIDAIEAAVKRCVESANIEYAKTSEGPYVFVSEQSILKVAEELISKL